MTNNLLVNAYNCLYYTTNQIRSVHCKHSEFDDVPQDLDVSIEVINFTTLADLPTVLYFDIIIY